MDGGALQVGGVAVVVACGAAHLMVCVSCFVFSSSPWTRTCIATSHGRRCAKFVVLPSIGPHVQITSMCFLRAQELGELVSALGRDLLCCPLCLKCRL